MQTKVVSQSLTPSVVDAIRRRAHTEEEARDIEQDMFDAAREMFGTPPPEDEEAEPQKSN